MNKANSNSLARFFSKNSIVAKPGFNRWLVPPASIAIHLCIGSVYAWSIFNIPLTRELGVVAPSSGDWDFKSVVSIFSVAIVFLGLAAATAGKWLEKVGPRTVGMLAALCWGGGFLIGSIGIKYHQLWLIYFGYGVIGGCGLGLGYVSPVSTLIRWFPDRRGMAAGMAIMGFGGGAIIAAPLKSKLIAHFAELPKYLGNVNEVNLFNEAGKRFAEIAGKKVEVVVSSVSDMASLPLKGPEGVYAVGTGNTGVFEAFVTLGIVYFVVMLLASLSYKIPELNWKPKGWTPPDEKKSEKKLITSKSVHIDKAIRTPQFYQLWIMLCFNVTAGIAVIGVAKTMIIEIFGSNLSSVVTASFAATYVLMISVFNMSGRFIWASVSDYIGRKRTYSIFFIMGFILYLSIPIIAIQAGTSTNLIWLIFFYISTMIIFTMYGGGFATIPAYLADLFGSFHVGGIHGRLLTAWSTAGILGPVLISYLRESSINKAIAEIAAKVDPVVFQNKFGEPISQLNKLVEAKTVSLSKLIEIAPPETVDPTSGLYNTTMYTMAALLAIALIVNLLVKKVNSKYYHEE
ncbi:MAG: OFA family MFS transporter [Prolixibacteraceae bacterium]|nr:OFA family MFS transporter [Prolixibacteraceae bacterium]